MFGLAFRFPAGRYHATPWDRNVNEANVAWPPEPWRILRALIACYWRKANRDLWSEGDLALLIDTLAEHPPSFCLPEGAVHSHTRHYMPIRKGKSESPTLVFDSFLHLPEGAEVEVQWPSTTLVGKQLDLAQDLASGIGYLGRAESWTECRLLTDAGSEPNCGPAELGIEGEPCRVLVPRSARSYQRERTRQIEREFARIQESSNKSFTELALRKKALQSFRVKGKGGVDTLPKRLVDALSLDTADFQALKWNQPPAAYEAIYSRARNVRPGVLSRTLNFPRNTKSMSALPTIARYLLVGHPRPRIEDAVKIGEVMRLAVMSKFGWGTEEGTGKRYRLAPWQISGRNRSGRPVDDPVHPHAFWLPEDADNDGWIDHITVFISSGMDEEILSKLNRVTRIWLTPKKNEQESSDDARLDEWRIALEGVGQPHDFSGSSRVVAVSRRWSSVTPFLASGHLKKHGYAGELKRLLKRRGFDIEGVRVKELTEIQVAGTPRHALNFFRFRSRGAEARHDSRGSLLEIKFPSVVQGPLALGYASHFGLGMFGSEDR